MKYSSVVDAIFLKRPNRFTAEVLINGTVETVHVRNTGRCREILKEGTPVILEESAKPGRKTAYTLVKAYKGNNLINIDSLAPNKVVYNAINEGRLQEFTNVSLLSREVIFQSSRFDLYYESADSRGFIEVKGVTLEQDGTAMFPDAPTQRGTKHIHEMIDAVKNGFTGRIVFVIQMQGVRLFTPNRKTDLEFSTALRKAVEYGVNVLAFDCSVTRDGMWLGKRIEVSI